MKDTSTAYLWWFLAGAFGGHQFYLNNKGRAWSMALTLGWLGVGVIIDLFTLPKQVEAANQRVADAPDLRTTVR